MRTTMCVLTLAWFTAATSHAQQIPIRQVGPVEAVAEKLTVPALMRPLSDGRLIMAQGRRLLLFSADLASQSVVLDSTALTSGPGGTLPFAPAFIAGLADTTFVVDRNGSSLLTIEPTGKVGRVVALPRSRDVSALAFAFSYMTAFMDPKGQLVYRASFPPPPPPPPAADGSRVMGVASDTFPIVRANFDTRSADTVAVLKLSSSRMTMTMGANNRISQTSTVQPYPVLDVWTLLPDGTVAVVRGSDYHVDWISLDGTRSSSPKMPFDWRRITDDDKTRIIDSVKAAQAVQRGRMDSLYKARGIDPATMSTLTYDVVRPNEIPDYFPPVRDAGIIADPDGNLWVLPSTSSNAKNGLLYDVINRKGDVFERVQLPTGCALSGLAKGGIVYLLCVPPVDPTAVAVAFPATARLERRRVIH